MKVKIQHIFIISFVLSLLLIACDSQDEASMNYLGHGDYWEAEFTVDEESGEAEIEINSLNDHAELEGIETIHYRYDWPHQSATFIDDKSRGIDSIELSDGNETDVTLNVHKGALTSDEEEDVFSGEIISRIDASDKADTIRLTIEWDEKEDVFDLEKDEGSELAQKVNNNSIYSILNSEFEIDSQKQITIHNVDERYKLVEIIKEDGRPHMGGTHYLIDGENGEIKKLFSEGFPEIEEVYEENITMKLEQHNGPQGRFYPYLLNIDFETGEQEEETYYEQLTDFYNREIGGSQQGLGLIEIESTEENIVFKFDETEESFIAGGMYSPDIELTSDSKLKEKYGHEKVLGIELKDTYLVDNFSKSDIAEHPKVLNIHVDEYQNALKTNHVFVVIEFSEDIEFTGEFEKVERESYMHDFHLIIK